MNDMIGNEVEEGDFLLDDRGKVFMAMSTSPLYKHEKLILVTEFPQRGIEKRIFLRQKLALKIDKNFIGDLSQKDLRVVWSRTYEDLVRPRERELIRQRRAEFQERRKLNI